MRRFVPLNALVLAATLAGCTADTPLVPALQSGAGFARAVGHLAAPLFVHRAPTAPPFKDEIATFTIWPGQSETAELTFADGSPFATLVLPADALLGATLNGAPVPVDRPLTITLQRVDASRFYVKFEPSGLVFNSAAAPTMIFNYTHAQLRGDAKVLEIWKQHRVGDSWIRINTTDDREARKARGRVEDFTAYVLSYPN